MLQRRGLQPRALVEQAVVVALVGRVLDSDLVIGDRVDLISDNLLEPLDLALHDRDALELLALLQDLLVLQLEVLDQSVVLQDRLLQLRLRLVQRLLVVAQLLDLLLVVVRLALQVVQLQARHVRGGVSQVPPFLDLELLLAEIGRRDRYPS